MEMDLKSVCRVCLQYNSESNYFCDEVEYDESIQLSKIFQKITGVEVNEYEDAKPCRLCQKCTERLLNAYDFVCSVEKAEIEIDNYIKGDILQSDEDESERLDKHFKTVANEVDIEYIEVLEEEFQAELDQSDIGNEVVVAREEVLVESEENITPVKTKEPRRSEDGVGSRLSKRMLSSHYKCTDCDRSFAKIETLERHIKVAHTAIPREELANISTHVDPTTSENYISCLYCRQTFKRRNNYIRHLMTNHSNEAELTEEDKKIMETKHNYKRSNCPYCGKNFTQASLIVHIRRHTGENPYQCNECDKAFPRRQDLVVHQRKHTGEKPHICTICGKTFSRANKLARHMRVHTGERPYKCTECQRCFAQSNDLKIHMRRHTGEKPYKCNVCTEAFICGAALRSHRRQKNHHSPKDEYDDPFANWRVCKRGLNGDTNETNFKVENGVEKIFI